MTNKQKFTNKYNFIYYICRETSIYLKRKCAHDIYKRGGEKFFFLHIIFILFS